MDYDPFKKVTSHVWIDVTVKVDREKSMLVDTPKGEVWLPKFAVGAKKKDASGNIVRIEIKRDIAEEKGIA